MSMNIMFSLFLYSYMLRLPAVASSIMFFRLFYYS
jgi:hypothetical protein